MRGDMYIYTSTIINIVVFFHKSNKYSCEGQINGGQGRSPIYRGWNELRIGRLVKWGRLISLSL